MVREYIKGQSFYIRLARYKVVTDSGNFHASKVINCAGLYADRVAQQFGFAKDYVMLPFKGKYLEYTGDDVPVSTNIYSVPSSLNPFLGPHFTLNSRWKGYSWTFCISSFLERKLLKV